MSKKYSKVLSLKLTEELEVRLLCLLEIQREKYPNAKLSGLARSFLVMGMAEFEKRVLEQAGSKR